MLTTHGLPLSEAEVACVQKIYGCNSTSGCEIRYADFLKDCNVLVFDIYGPYTGAKSTYNPRFTDFSGSKALDDLMLKIKQIIKKDRIRLLEFFQDHDLLRKGVLSPTKFRSVLHSQKVQLTLEEYELLEKVHAVKDSTNAPLVNYVNFCQDIAKIFTENDLEKNPTKRLTSFTAPSILDPRDVLNGEEEQVLDGIMKRLGTEVAHRRLLIKPFF